MKQLKCLAILSLLWSGIFSASCPGGWSPVRKSCYYTGERFSGINFYSALAFCRSFGTTSHLIEPNDQEEYNYIQEAAKNVSWSDGPWIGMIRIFGDRRIVWPSLVATAPFPSGDNNSYVKMLENIAENSGSGYNCGGLDKSGGQFGFWSCTPSGSPWCEIDLA